MALPEAVDPVGQDMIRSEEDDLLQETAVTAAERAPQFCPIHPVRPYFPGTMLRCARDPWRGIWNI